MYIPNQADRIHTGIFTVSFHAVRTVALATRNTTPNPRPQRRCASHLLNSPCRPAGEAATDTAVLVVVATSHMIFLRTKQLMGIRHRQTRSKILELHGHDPALQPNPLKGAQDRGSKPRPPPSMRTLLDSGRVLRATHLMKGRHRRDSRHRPTLLTKPRPSGKGRAHQPIHSMTNHRRGTHLVTSQT